MRRIAASVVLLGGYWIPAQALYGQWSLQLDAAAGRLEIHDSGRPAATYAYRDAQVRRPYFANLSAPNGFRVTRSFPPREGVDSADHAMMHPGVSLAFGDVNGGDFWRGEALIRHERFIETPHVNGQDEVRFVAEQQFVLQGRVLCTQRAERTLLRRRHGYLLLFDSTFHAVEDIEFGDQEEMGLGVRMHTPLCVEGGNGRILNSYGQVDEAQVWGERALWCDYSGSIDGHRTGALLMPYPRNVRPCRFHARDYGFMAANPFAEQVFGRPTAQVVKVAAGASLRLRFGILLYSLPHEEAIDAQAAYSDYLQLVGAPASPSGPAWARHTIDANSIGADGVRVGDVNRDGLPDLTTPWEEGGQTRVYVNPGPAAAKQPWPSVVVGRAASPEDAVLVDLDGDGYLDVATCCEGRERTVHVQWSPPRFADLLNAEQWTSQVVPTTRRASQWMFALPLEIDDQAGIDLVIGSKGKDATVSWLRSPAEARRLEDWQRCSIARAGWIMSLRSRDIDADGDQDIVVSDRRGEFAGCWWLENPGPAEASQGAWNRRAIAGQGREIMFLDLADVDGDGLEDCVSAVAGSDILLARRSPGATPVWEETTIRMPAGVGSGKAVAVGDVDVDGRPDLVVSCEHAEHASGVFWLRQRHVGQWSPQEISGTEQGVKFDRIELLDLDRDGDLDVVTCEERDNLGVVWYENPLPTTEQSP